MVKMHEDGSAIPEKFKSLEIWTKMFVYFFFPP